MTLAVARLWLSHFRSHRALDLGFDGRPVAIFGPNGAGKTNLIEALSLLSPGRGLRGAAAADLQRAPERIGWKLRAEVLSPDGAHGMASWSEGAGRVIEIDGKTFLLEMPLRADFALVNARQADHIGNLAYALTARNFNPLIAMAADVVLAEPQEIVPVGVIPPDAVMTPSVVVTHIIAKESARG